MQDTALLQRVTYVALLIFVSTVTLSISMMQAAYIVALAAFLVTLYQSPQLRQIRLPLLIPIGGFAFASLVSTIAGVTPYRSLVELRNVLEVAVFYLAVNTIRSERQAMTLVNTLIAAGAIIALYGLLQAIMSSTAFRVHGTTNYMTFAGQLMLICTMALAQLFCHYQSWHTRWLIPVLIVLLAALLHTHTRNAWLGFATACSVIVLLTHPRLLWTLPVVALGAFLLSPNAVKTRVQTMWNLQDITLQERLSMWQSGLHMASDYPWTGIGMGSMEDMYERYRLADSPIASHRRMSHLHNNVIQILAERGVIGLSSWLAIWVAFFYQAWQAYRSLSPPSDNVATQLPRHNNQRRALLLGSMASVIGFIVAGGFEHNFGDVEVVTVLYFLMALPFILGSRGLPTTGSDMSPRTSAPST